MAFPRKYSDEARTGSVQRVVDRKRTEPRNRAIFREVALEFGVGEQSLRQWVSRYDDGSYRYSAADGFASAPQVESRDMVGADPRILSGRVAELERQLEALREENAVLKKALRIMAVDLPHESERTAS
jgi:transposase